mmetsp:Transcript_53235/g.142430  ORF Transcript_53235/g.142430 Transcript_53235/m.142430 type:complete len:270 (+) Transcript_53235:247-1056(+)
MPPPYNTENKSEATKELVSWSSGMERAACSGKGFTFMLPVCAPSGPMATTRSKFSNFFKRFNNDPPSMPKGTLVNPIATAPFALCALTRRSITFAPSILAKTRITNWILAMSTEGGDPNWLSHTKLKSSPSACFRYSLMRNSATSVTRCRQNTYSSGASALTSQLLSPRIQSVITSAQASSSFMKSLAPPRSHKQLRTRTGRIVPSDCVENVKVTCAFESTFTSLEGARPLHTRMAITKMITTHTHVDCIFAFVDNLKNIDVHDSDEIG